MRQQFDCKMTLEAVYASRALRLLKIACKQLNTKLASSKRAFFNTGGRCQKGDDSYLTYGENKCREVYNSQSHLTSQSRYIKVHFCRRSWYDIEAINRIPFCGGVNLGLPRILAVHQKRQRSIAGASSDAGIEQGLHNTKSCHLSSISVAAGNARIVQLEIPATGPS